MLFPDMMSFHIKTQKRPSQLKNMGVASIFSTVDKLFTYYLLGESLSLNFFFEVFGSSEAYINARSTKGYLWEYYWENFTYN